MLLIKNISVFISSVVAVTAAIGRRDVQDLTSAVDNIDSKAQAFTTAIQEYPGGLLPALAIASADTDLINALNTGTLTASQIQGPLSDNDFAILEPSLLSLPSDVKSGLDAMKAQRDSLKDSGVITATITNLINTKAAHDNFTIAVLNVLPVDAQDSGRQQQVGEDAAFDDAISWFQAVA